MRINHSVIVAMFLAVMQTLSSSGLAAVVNFDNPWLDGGQFNQYRTFEENGVSLIVFTTYPFSYTRMKRYGTPLNDPRSDNGTPHMEYFLDYPVAEFVYISLTNGSSFGLASVDLAEPYPNAPHVSSAVTFVGFKLDGTTVTNTLTIDGINDGAGGFPDFQTFSFDSSFSSGLTRVDIPTSNWAMDNLVIVPEPGTAGLLVIGLLMFGGWAKSKQRKCPTTTAT